MDEKNASVSNHFRVKMNEKYNNLILLLLFVWLFLKPP
jgi:hypothetical protein